MRSNSVLEEIKTLLGDIAPVGLWTVPAQRPPMIVLDIVGGGVAAATMKAPDKTITVQVTGTGKTPQQAAWLMDKAMAKILAYRIKTGWRTQFTTWGIPLTPQIDGFYSYVGQVKIWGEVEE